MNRRLASLLVCSVLAACKPATVSEAEARGDVRWLEQSGTPEAVAALGRLADKDPKALAALQARADYDPEVYAAAWVATIHGSAWGPTMIEQALADPARAELAASKLDRHDPHLAQFVAPLDAALVRLGASKQNLAVASALASAGVPAHAAIEARLADAATRGAMCRGIAAPDTSADARATLVAVPAGSRDHASCVDAVVRLCVDSPAALEWVATDGEPALLGAASKSDLIECARLHDAWTKALETREEAMHAALVVPLSYAIRRCTQVMDPVLTDALVRLPQTTSVVVNAIDPYDSYGKNLPHTCQALARVVATSPSPMIRERADDARDHGCKSQ